MKKNIRKIVKPGEGIIKSILKLGLFALTKPGFNHFKQSVRKIFNSSTGGNDLTRYDEWIKAQQNISTLRNDYENTINSIAFKPKFSIVFTVNDPSVSFLQASIQSIFDQLYSDWELCISYPITAGREIKELLNAHQKNARIRIIPAEPIQQVYAITNKALSETTGDHILFMEQGDMLTPDCLYSFVKHLNILPAAPLIYADEDKLDNDGNFSMPYFKSDWAPDSLLSGNYIGSPFVIKKDFIQQLGGFKAGFNGNEEYDLLLRATEKIAPGHIRKIIYHKRIRSITKRHGNTAKKALDEALVRRGTPGHTIAIPDTPDLFYVNYEITKPGKVSILIPTKDHVSLLKTAVDSIIQKTDYPDFEIIVINNNSVSKDFFELMAEYGEKYGDKFRCIDAGFPFNYSKLINFGVSESKGEYILMLNNDVEVIHSDWMTKMVSYSQHEKTGAVGVKLLYPDNTIQHAGIILGGSEATAHIVANADKNEHNYHTQAVNNYSAVTGACLICRKDLYNEVGGMDEGLPVEYNDVDFCLKLLTKGYYNVYLPIVTLYHHESATRGHPFRSKNAWKQHNKDITIFRSKWQKIIDHDPYYNINFKLGIDQAYV